jgi:hypothetical protein
VDTAFGNIEILLRTWALPMFTGVRIVSEKPADLESALPVLQIARGGGDDPRTFMCTDRVVVDVDAWEASRTAASDLAEDARLHFRHDLPNSVIDGFVVTWVTTQVAPRWQPDPNPRVWRYTSTYEIGIHPQ